MIRSELRRSLDEVNTVFDVDRQIANFNKRLKAGKRGKGELEYELKDIVSNYTELFDGIQLKFYNMVNRILKSRYETAKFYHQKKPVKSILNKVIERGKSIANIADLVRGAVLLDTSEEVEDFVKRFQRKYPANVVKLDVKSKGGDPKFGYYGSYHLDLNIDGLDVELQIMTKKLWQFKDAGHKIYDKWRTKPEKTPAGDMALSKKIFAMGNRPKFVKESEEISLEQLFSQKINLEN